MVESTKPADAADALGRCIVAMLLREPFYGHILGGIGRRIGADVPTLAVALTPRGPELIVNPAFFMRELKASERVGVVKHEALHLVLRHLYRPLFKGANPVLFNIAADLVVNQLVAPWPLPASAVTLDLFSDLNLLPDQTLEWYYERLDDLHRKMKGDRIQGGAAETLRRIIDSEPHGDHQFWAAGGGLGFPMQDDEAENSMGAMLGGTLCKALESDIERLIVAARRRTPEKFWARLPQSFRSVVDAIEAARQPTVDWRRVLRLFASSGCHTKIVATKRRMSKRFDSFPGVRIKRDQCLAVVVDTSGSIDDGLLAAFFREIHGIWRAGSEVVVLECDAEVQRHYRYSGKAPSEVNGRGGTSFDPAFEWLRDPSNGRFDACIYLTDGCAPEPTVRPRCPLLWVVLGEDSSTEHLIWGRVIHLKV